MTADVERSSATSVAETETSTFDYRLPSLGADMDAGRVVEWRVAVGDEVHRGDVMAVVETEKSDIDVEIWHDGVVEDFLVELGEEIAVGTPVARLRAQPSSNGATPSIGPATSDPHSVALPPPSAAGRAASVDEPHVTSPRPGRTAQRGIAASPYARRLAVDRGVDLATVHGSGPSGAIVASDVVAAATVADTTTDTLDPVRHPSDLPRQPTAGGDHRTVSRRSPASMRRLIAERMTRANREIPHYHLVRDVDVAALQEWLRTTNEGLPVAGRILPAAAYVRAVAIAAARHRELNGFWIDDEFRVGDGVHVAMAISLRRGGLVTPHVTDADQKSIAEIMARLQELVAAARTGTLKASWMTGATITLTNLGETGADRVHGVISPPQVALVGMGRPAERPWVVDGTVVVRPVLSLTLAADHRATDGATGSRFLATLAHALEHPEEL